MFVLIRWLASFVKEAITDINYPLKALLGKEPTNVNNTKHKKQNQFKLNCAVILRTRCIQSNARAANPLLNWIPPLSFFQPSWYLTLEIAIITPGQVVLSTCTLESWFAACISGMQDCSYITRVLLLCSITIS